MPRVVLVHWNDDEAAACLEQLRSSGFDATHHRKSDNVRVSHYRAAPPDAFVIDLSRLPSHGREIATYLRGHKILRFVPLVFAGGDAEKVAAIRKTLPDATYSGWDRIEPALKKAIKSRPSDPVAPAPMMERYGGRTVAEKMGIKPGDRVSVITPPADYLKVLDPLPADVEIAEDSPATRQRQVTVWFVHDIDEFMRTLRSYGQLAAKSKLWIVWRKQRAGASGTINQNLIRETALEAGLVDYKICSVNDVWTGMLFALKKS